MATYKRNGNRKQKLTPEQEKLQVGVSQADIDRRIGRGQEERGRTERREESDLTRRQDRELARIRQSGETERAYVSKGLTPPRRQTPGEGARPSRTRRRGGRSSLVRPSREVEQPAATTEWTGGMLTGRQWRQLRRNNPAHYQKYREWLKAKSERRQEQLARRGGGSASPSRDVLIRVGDREGGPDIELNREDFPDMSMGPGARVRQSGISKMGQVLRNQARDLGKIEGADAFAAARPQPRPTAQQPQAPVQAQAPQAPAQQAPAYPQPAPAQPQAQPPAQPRPQPQAAGEIAPYGPETPQQVNDRIRAMMGRTTLVEEGAGYSRAPSALPPEVQRAIDGGVGAGMSLRDVAESITRQGIGQVTPEQVNDYVRRRDVFSGRESVTVPGMGQPGMQPQMLGGVPNPITQDMRAMPRSQYVPFMQQQDITGRARTGQSREQIAAEMELPVEQIRQLSRAQLWSSESPPQLPTPPAPMAPAAGDVGVLPASEADRIDSLDAAQRRRALDVQIGGARKEQATGLAKDLMEPLTKILLDKKGNLQSILNVPYLVEGYADERRELPAMIPAVKAAVAGMANLTGTERTLAVANLRHISMKLQTELSSSQSDVIGTMFGSGEGRKIYEDSLAQMIAILDGYAQQPAPVPQPAQQPSAIPVNPALPQ